MVMAISPSEETKLQMFVWSHIIFSLGFVSGHYKDFAGDVAASIAFTNDLNGEQSLSAADLEGLYTLDTAEVDDCGFWVRFQSLIPGILEWNQKQSVICSFTDLARRCFLPVPCKGLPEECSHATFSCTHSHKRLCGTQVRSSPVRLELQPAGGMRALDTDRELCVGCKLASSQTSGPAELCYSPKEHLKSLGDCEGHSPRVLLLLVFRA
ncbi:Clustered mitochondria protein-like protein [Plecturocebus cupreus]